MPKIKHSSLRQEYISVLIAICVFTWFLARAILVFGPINIWSLSVLSKKLDTSHITLPSIKPPENHLRAHLWTAQDAFDRNDLTTSRKLIEPLLAKGDRMGLRLLGNILMMQGDFQPALNAWIQAQDYKSLNEVAETKKTKGLLNEALSAYRAAYVTDVEKGTIPLADFLWNHNIDPDEAKILVNHATNLYLASSHRNAWFRWLGDALRKDKMWGDSKAYYQRALQNNMNDWQAHLGLGWVFYDSGEGIDAAILEFEKVINLVPDQGDGYFVMGQLLANEKRYDEADIWFTKAIERNQNARWWWLTRASVARESGHLSTSLYLYYQTAESFPDWAPVYYEMSLAFWMNKEPENAIQTIERALQLMNSPVSRYYIRYGQFSEWIGDFINAEIAFQRALTLDPKNQTAQEAIKRIGH